MKIEQLAYRIAGEALTLLEKKYHYRIAEDHKRDIQNTVVKNLTQYLKEPSGEEMSED
jgi:hypothetical protein